MREVMEQKCLLPCEKFIINRSRSKQIFNSFAIKIPQPLLLLTLRDFHVTRFIVGTKNLFALFIDQEIKYFPWMKYNGGDNKFINRWKEINLNESKIIFHSTGCKFFLYPPSSKRIKRTRSMKNSGCFSYYCIYYNF